MFVGHLGAGLALKRVEKRANLGVLFGAVLFADLLLGIFILSGIEKVIVPPDFAGKHYLTFVFPYSHGLVATVIWSIIAFLIFRSVQRFKMNTGFYPGIIAAALFSHFVLDVIVHVPDIPVLTESSFKLGFGLWEYLPLALSIEISLAFLGLYIYLRTVRPRMLEKAILFSVILLLSFFTVAGQAFTSTPPRQDVVAVSLISQTIAVAVFGYWIERRVTKNKS